jgi:hypothetical protein
MLADGTRRTDARPCDKREDIGAPIDKQLLNLWLCAGTEEMIFGFAVSELVTPQESNEIRKLKCAAADRLSSQHGFPSFL